MKCNRCGKKIDESEIFCSECKKYLKKFSSKSSVKELEELTIEQKKLTDLENTKELDNLKELVEEKLEKEDIDLEKTQVLTKEELKEELPKKDNKNKKKLIILISSIVILLISIIILLILFLPKEKEKENEITINYKKVIKDYGDNVVDIIKDYISLEEELPTWQYVLENLDYKEYEVECSIHNIYSDGSIYLSGCKVNGKKIKNIYGSEKEEIKEGKKIEIYKETYEGFNLYSNIPHNSSLAGTITCKTEECSYVNAFDNYALIIENNEYYLYDYINDSLVFGPFILQNEYDVLVNNNKLYGIIYKDEEKFNIYNVNTNKILKNIKGTLYPGEMGFDPTIMYKYNYAIFINGNKSDFVNLKTGNVSYSIEENIVSFIEGEKIVYIETITSNNKYKLYNSNGKVLFDGEEYINFVIGKNNLLVSTEKQFKIYDNKLNLIFKSNTYDNVLGLYEDFVVVLSDNDLVVLDLKGKEIIVFEDSFDQKNNIFYNHLSQKLEDKIILIVENKNIPYGSKGNIVEYYYIFSTKESGLIEKTGL